MNSENQEAFKIETLIKETYRSNAYRPPKSLFVAARVSAAQLDKQHSCTAFFYTVGLGSHRGTTVEEEWVEFGQVIATVLQKIYHNNLIAAIVMGVEMYSKNRGRPNTKALRPHIHMTVFAYNDFLRVPKENIEEQLLKEGLDFKIDLLTDHQGIAKSMCYTVKSGNQPILRKATNTFLNIEPISIVVNPTIKENPIESFIQALKSKSTPFTIRKLGPAIPVDSVTRFEGNTKMQIANFLRKQCLQTQTAFYKGFIMEKQHPAHFTWVQKSKVENFLQYVITPEMPDSYKEAVFNAAKWILEEGAIDNKNIPVQPIFPRLRIQPNLWEFLDKQVYDFQTGTLLETIQLEPFTSCNKYTPISWDKMPKPERLLRVIKLLMPDERQRFDFIAALGGLFHDLGRRKQQKAIWIYGKSNTYKTWFVNNFLEATFNEVLVKRISQSRTEFQYGRLMGITEGILYVDEFRSEDFKRPAQLLQITDGQTTVIDEKYIRGEETNFRGHTVVTSNEGIQDTQYNHADKQAFEVRYQQALFKPSDENQQELLMTSQNQLAQEEWLALAIFANNKYLQKAFGKSSEIPQSWKNIQTRKETLLIEATKQIEQPNEQTQPKPTEQPKKKRGRPALTPEQKKKKREQQNLKTKNK